MVTTLDLEHIANTPFSDDELRSSHTTSTPQKDILPGEFVVITAFTMTHLEFVQRGPIHPGDSTSLAVRKGFPVLVTQDADDLSNFVARFDHAQMSASGDSLSDAIENLKDTIAANFEHFSSLPQEKLGPVPQRQLRVLCQYVERQ